LANKRYEIEQKKENIEELNKRIECSEQELIDKLRKENDLIREEIKAKLNEFEKLEEDIINKENLYKSCCNIKDKQDFLNEQSNYT